MLVFTRRRNESILLAGATVTVVDMLPDRVRLGITEPGRTPPGSPEYDMDRDFGGNLVIDPTNYSTNNNELDNLLDIVRELFYILRDNSIPTLSTRNAVDSIVSATRQAVERAATATADCGSVCGDDGAELDGAAMPQPTPRRQACAERAASPPPSPPSWVWRHFRSCWHPDPAFRQRAIEELKNNTRAVPVLTDALRSFGADVRTNAACVLGHFGPSAGGALPALVSALEDAHVGVRCNAAWALGQIGPGAVEAIPGLVKACREEDYRVRSSAAKALTQIGVEAVPVLVKERHFIGVLARIGPMAVPSLVESLTGVDGPAKVNAAEALGWIGPGAAEAVPALTAAMRDSRVRAEAAAALGRIGPGTAEAVPALMTALEDAKIDASYTVAQALCNIGPQVIPHLVRALESAVAGVREKAAWALGRIGPGAACAVPALITAFKASQDCERAQIVVALGRTGGGAVEVVSTLVEALQDRNDYVRGKAVSTLSALGWLAKAAVPSLTTIIGNPNESDDLRREVSLALAAIGPESRLQAEYPEVDYKLRKLREAGGRDWDMMRGHLRGFRTVLEHGSCAAAAGKRGVAGGGDNLRYHLKMLTDKLGERFAAQAKRPEGLRPTRAGEMLREWIELHEAELEG